MIVWRRLGPGTASLLCDVIGILLHPLRAGQEVFKAGAVDPAVRELNRWDKIQSYGV